MLCILKNGSCCFLESSIAVLSQLDYRKRRNFRTIHGTIGQGLFGIFSRNGTRVRAGSQRPPEELDVRRKFYYVIQLDEENIFLALVPDLGAEECM